MSSILQNINSFLPQAQKMLPEVQKLFKYVMGEAGEIINFVNYDKGLPYKNDDYKTYEDRCEACNDITVGVLDQGMFQMTQLDSKRYKEIQDFLDKHKNNIAEINFFMLSESLEDGANPLLDIMPVMNIYHTAIGITFVDKNGKIIRSMVLQLNFGPLDGIDDAFTRFLCPQFCMNMVKDPNTGNAKNPLTFTNEEFATNLFIDYSKTISSLLVSFNESADYVTEELIKTMACVDVANLTTAAPEPYKQFINQNITCQHLYDAYNLQRNGILKKYQGTADGTIFCLNSYGPNIFVSQGGAILHFATLKNVEKMKSFIDWCFVNYGGCSESLEKNNLMHYCVMGIDKVIPIGQLNNQEIETQLQKPNIISTDNGFIREMLGRPTHCNIVMGVVITLIDQLAKNDNDWKIYTDWENKDLQEINSYMINPTIISLPIVSFPQGDGWERGISVKELNTNPIYLQDKIRFHKIWYFAKLLIKGFNGQARSFAVKDETNDMSMYKIIYIYLTNVFTNSVVNNILKSLNPNIKSKVNQGKLILFFLLFIYVVIKFELFDNFYWATGQSTVNMKGESDLLFTEQYPTIWKIPLNKENRNILIAYVEKIFLTKSDNSNKTAGQIYLDLESSKGQGIYEINKMVHTLPLNKLFLFFPGVKNNNECNKGYLKGRKALTYIPQIKYNLINHNKKNSKSKINKYIILLLIVILLLLLTMGFFDLINRKK